MKVLLNYTMENPTAKKDTVLEHQTWVFIVTKNKSKHNILKHNVNNKRGDCYVERSLLYSMINWFLAIFHLTPITWGWLFLLYQILMADILRSSNKYLRRSGCVSYILYSAFSITPWNLNHISSSIVFAANIFNRQNNQVQLYQKVKQHIFTVCFHMMTGRYYNSTNLLMHNGKYYQQSSLCTFWKNRERPFLINYDSNPVNILSLK